jgi:hypothetical protein
MHSHCSVQEAVMEIFDRSREASDRFLHWRSAYPDSFVLNIDGQRCMLHLASCGHFVFADYKVIVFAPKRASHNKEELEEWVRAQHGLQYTVCHTCKP